MLSTPSGLPSGSRRFNILAIVTGVLLLFTTLRTLKGQAYYPVLDAAAASRQNAPDNQILEIEGLKLGLPFAPVNTTAGVESVDELLEALQKRFAETTYKSAQYPSCNPNFERYEKTAIKSLKRFVPKATGDRSGIVSFAINVHNSENIIPAQAAALIEAIGQLVGHNNVYVSIFENGSDDKTSALLADFAAALLALGVDGLWVHTSHLNSDYARLDRIVVLSEIRNMALAPLMPYVTGSAGGTLVFLNDVVMCASDVLELVHQQRLQKADMVAGVDWGTVIDDEADPPAQLTRLYDMWVLRGINGDLPYPFEKAGGYSPTAKGNDWVHDAFSTQTDIVHSRWLDGRPFPVYSAWGGMAAFNASLFTAMHLRFRSSTVSGWEGGSPSSALRGWGYLLSQDGYLAGDCPGASECEYIARDIWNLQQGQARILLAPQVRTAYSVKDWKVMQTLAPAVRRVSAGEEELDRIDWSTVQPPAEVVCIPTRGKYSEVVNTWDESNLRKKLDPMYKYDELGAVRFRRSDAAS